MPTYEYRCPSCGHEFEKFERRMTAGRAMKCPQCGARAERLISGGGGFVFKGSGFYITDYKRAGEKAPAGEGKSDTGADGKSEAKEGAKGAGKAGDKPSKTSDAPPKKTKSSGADS